MGVTEEVLLLLTARDSTQGVMRNFAQGITDLTNRSKTAAQILELQASTTSKMNDANAIAVLRIQAAKDAAVSQTAAQNAVATATMKVQAAQDRLNIAQQKAISTQNNVNASLKEVTIALQQEEAAAIRAASAEDAYASALGRVASAQRGVAGANIERDAAIGRADEASIAQAAAMNKSLPGAAAVAGSLAPGVIVAAAVAAIAVGGYSIMTALSYNNALTNVGARTGTSSAGMNTISASIQKYLGSGMDLQSPNSLANGAYPLLSSGLNPNQTASLIPLAAGVGSVSGVDTSTAANAITDLADTFGKGPNSTSADFGVYANQLIAAGQKGKVPFSTLLPNLTKFAGVANVAGVSSADALAWLDKQTLSGATAARGAVGLQSFLNSMILKPSNTTEAFADKMGFNVGPDAIKKAGGLFQYVQQLKDVGALDPAVMSKILGQKNAALGVDYLFTGGGLSGSAGSPMDIAANISGNHNALPAAQAQQLTSTQSQMTATWNRFNGDAIKMGDAMGTLAPSLLLVAKAGLQAAESLGSVAGWTGNKIDQLNQWLDQKADQVNLPKKLGYGNNHPEQHSTGTNGVPSAALPGEHENPQLYGGSPNPYAIPGSLGTIWAAIIANSGIPTEGVGSGAGGNGSSTVPTHALSAQQAYMQRFNYQTAGRNQIAFAHQNALNAVGLANPTQANRPYQDAVHELTILMSKNASPNVVDAQVKKIATALGGTSYTTTQRGLDLATQQGRATAYDTKRLVSSYNDMYKAAEIFSASVTINHGSAQQQEAAAQKQYTAAVNLANVQFATGKIDKLGQLNAIGAAQNNLAGTYNTGANTQLGNLQDKLQLASYKGVGVAGDVAAVVQYMTANATALGLNKTQLAIQTYQLQQQYGQTQKIPAANLIRPNVGNLAYNEAGFGTSIAQLSGSSSNQDQALALMQSQLEAANSTIVQLRQEVTYLQQIKDGVLIVAANTSATSPQRRKNNLSSIPK